MKNDTTLIEKALGLCAEAGVSFDRDSVLGLLETYVGLIREWNAYASLVSVVDAETNLGNHCVDSLALAPCLRSFIEGTKGCYIDIGSGGGFPAVPLCILFPNLEARLIERNTKKTVFLKKVVRRLSLENVSIMNESFDGGEDGETRRLITSRAIEKPEEAIRRLLEGLAGGDVFLCQTESIHEMDVEFMGGFSVDEIIDEFSVAGMRRNRLYQIELLS
ncbi:MAG: 16S rRNA (guanine(527)-N(7))-methyltransferase RsmG [Candidatus Hydrogenedentota bacterium]